jgi:hypothetical protein
VRSGRRVLGAWAVASLAFTPGCERDGALDTVADPHADPSVWKADADKVAGVLPKRVGAFAPSEGADPFHTSYATGPVFGASCIYADGARQLAVRIESGNVKARAGVALDAHPGSPASATDRQVVSHEATVHGHAAVVRWQPAAKTGEVSFVVSRRYLVQVRLVPAASEDEAVATAEAVDLSGLDGLALQGVTR